MREKYKQEGNQNLQRERDEHKTKTKKKNERKVPKNWLD